MSEHTWDIYTTAHEAWEAMYADCVVAKESILLEQYIFTHDATIGQRFAYLLMQKAAEGVDVKILLDGAGSFKLYHSNVPRLLREAGAEVIFFKPLKLHLAYRFKSWFFRDHRKMLVVDGKIGHVGGVGINGRMKEWRDTHIRITGQVVTEIEEAFYHLRARTINRTPRRYPRRTDFDKTFHFVTNAPHYRRRYLYKSLVENIRTANKFIYITSPYFIPDIRIFRLLRLASKRGVDVRIITPLVSDHLAVDLASYSYFGLALRSGARIYTYIDQVLHAKSIIIDGEWASVGSSNLDNLSLLFNYEGNIVSTDKNFINQLMTHFHQDTAHSLEILRHHWRHRPLWQKIAEVLTWPFHKIL
jgi:cardiolipin synthase